MRAAASTQPLGHLLSRRMQSLAIVIILLAAPFVSLAQSGRGTVKGVVRDAADTAIPKVQIVFEKHHLKEEITSDESGNYEVQLPPGTYTVSAKKQGYRPPKPQTVRVKSKGVTTWDILFPPIDIISDPLPDPTPIRKPSSFLGAWPNKSRWTGVRDFRIKRDRAKLLGSAVARSTQPLCGRSSACPSSNYS